jgi:hypothetical protein
LRFNFEQSSRLTPDRGFIFDFVIRQIRASLKRSALSRSNSSGVSLANWLSVRFNFIVESPAQSRSKLLLLSATVPFLLRQRLERVWEKN